MPLLIDSIHPSINRSGCIDEAEFDELVDTFHCLKVRCPFLKIEDTKTDNGDTIGFLYCGIEAEILLRSSLARHNIIKEQVNIPRDQRDSYEKITAHALVDAKIEVLLEHQKRIPLTNCFNGFSHDSI